MARCAGRIGRTSHDIMEMFEIFPELRGREKQYGGTLSGGEQQRVAIARALANDPDVIFADEPTGNLATAQGEEILDILEGLNKRGVTIVIVTHSENVADRAERLITMRDGRVDSDQTAARV